MKHDAWSALLPDGAYWRTTETAVHADGTAPVGRGARGEPLWPVGLVGSITHAGGCRTLATAPADRVEALGIDMEPQVPIRPEVWPHFLDDDELDQLLRLPPPQRGFAALSRWCLKEAVFKALAGRVPFGALPLRCEGNAWRPAHALSHRLIGMGIGPERIVMQTATADGWQYAVAFRYPTT